MVPVGFSVAELTPSKSCGPFHGLSSVWNEVEALLDEAPLWIQNGLLFLGTAPCAVPTVIILILAAYYYYAVAAANKHMVSLLKHQLVLEGHDKQFLLKRLDRILKRVQELEQTTEHSSALGDFSNNDATLDIRSGDTQ